MKKKYSIVLLLLAVILLLPAFAIPSSASSAYQTYTYSIGGQALLSPDAYSARYPVLTSDEIGLTAATGKALKNPNDLIIDEDGKCYIADTDNNRIVALDRNFNFLYVISEFINDRGIEDSLSAPQGVFAFRDQLWVCDTGNRRLVVFDRATQEFIRIVAEPESQLLNESTLYTPIALAIDKYGTIYVVSSSTGDGIIVMDSTGEFIGYIGAQAVSLSAWELLWRRIQSEEQKAQSEANKSKPYNNIAITEEEFIYVTTDQIDAASVRSAIQGKDTSGKYLPVKLLNSAGDEIMKRNGFWPPAGEVDISAQQADSTQKGIYTDVSLISDVAVGPERTWSIIDYKRNKIFTYDYNGNLLFAFGDKGAMLGSISSIEAIAYQGSNLIVLDKGMDNTPCRIVIYDRTHYGDILIEAIAAENSQDYKTAIQSWEAVLQSNINFDAAYVGIGNSLNQSGQYKESLKYYERAYDTKNWSESYKEVRKEWMSKWFLLLFAIIILLVVGVVKWFAFAAKVNKRVATDGKYRKTFGQELMYGFYVLFHPFDGFYDLKHERRGSVRAAIVFLVITILAFFYQGIGQGYVLNPTRSVTTIWSQMISVLVPVFLFVLANWCLTTLFDGEGSFKDIFVATCYSLLPLPLIIIPATIASNWVTTSEASLVGFFGTLALIWVGYLLFFGTMVTHDYSLAKNLITILGTIVAMAFIVFIVLLFSMLLSKLVSLVTNIVTELRFRA